MIKFVNEPMRVLIQVVQRLYPGIKVKVFLSDFDPEKEGYIGCTSFFDDGGTPEIHLTVNATYPQLLDTLAHELAHIAVGYSENDHHGPEWEAVYDKFYQEYNKTVDELIAKHGGKKFIGKTH